MIMTVFSVFIVTLLASIGSAAVFEGFLTDRLSLDRVVAQDGANMLLNPQAHTALAALQDESVASGFAILTAPTAADPTQYGPIYNLTAASNYKAVAFLSMQPVTRNNLLVRVNGQLVGATPGQQLLEISDANITFSPLVAVPSGFPFAQPQDPPLTAIGETEFVAVFDSELRYELFAARRDIATLAIRNESLTLTFLFLGVDREAVYDSETQLMVMSAQARAARYGIVSLWFPTDAPLTASPLVPASPSDAPNEKLLFSIRLRLYHHYRDQNGDFRVDGLGPMLSVLRNAIAVSLAIDVDRVEFRGALGTVLRLLPNERGLPEWFARFSILDAPPNVSAGAGAIPTRSTSEVVAILLNNETSRRVCTVIPGCVAIGWQRAAQLLSFSDVENDGMDAYFDEKIEFLIAIIVTFVIMVVTLGYLWHISQKAQTTLLSSVAKTRQVVADTAPIGLQVPSPQANKSGGGGARPAASPGSPENSPSASPQNRY